MRWPPPPGVRQNLIVNQKRRSAQEPVLGAGIGVRRLAQVSDLAEALDCGSRGTLEIVVFAAFRLAADTSAGRSPTLVPLQRGLAATHPCQRC